MKMQTKTPSGWLTLGAVREDQSMAVGTGTRVANAMGTFPNRIDLRKVTNAAQMFMGVSEFDGFNIVGAAGITDATQMFMQCSRLKTGPTMDTSAMVTADRMFAICSALTSTPAYDLGSVLSAKSMFTSCTSMVTAPSLQFSTTAGVDATDMFFGCSNLVTMPATFQIRPSVATGMWQACSKLLEIPPVDFSLVESLTNTFSSCTSLTRIRATGIKRTFSIASCKLQAAQLNELFSNLGGGGGQTVTITGNPGAATCNRTLATTKGWTVTG